MKNFYNIFQKEIKELMTKEMLIGLVFMVVMFGMMGSFIGQIEKEAKEPINLAVLDLDNSKDSKNVLNILSERENVKIKAVIKKDNINEAIDEAKEKEAAVLLVIADNFGKNIKEMKKTDLEVYSIIKGFGMSEAISSETLIAIINSINKEISNDFIQKAFPDKNPEEVTNILNVKEFIIVKDKMAQGNPAMIRALATSHSAMIPLILMILIMYAGMMIITSMGLEKENKTLETLLTLPLKRISIVAGKMAGAAVVALLMAVVFMLGFRYYMSSMTPNIPGSEAILENLGLVMAPLSYLLFGISLFLAILIALAVCMVLGMFAQDTKSAQTMNMPIVLLVMIPYFLLMFKDIEMFSLSMKIFLYAIPFSHPIIASKALIFQNYSLVFGGIIYMIVFAIATMYLAVRLFNTDKILTAKFSLKRLSRK
jgi:ABC-2 type transport system permease protein